MFSMAQSFVTKMLSPAKSKTQTQTQPPVLRRVAMDPRIVLSISR
jgi:hypothetical protein